MSEPKIEEILGAILSKCEVLELEAARLVLLAKTNKEDKVLGGSAALVYETVLALRDNLKELQERTAAAGCD